MPAIRDFSQGYHATTTYKHVEAPMPAYAAGDLLLAFISIDDSAGVSAQDVIGGRRAKYVYMNAVDYTSQAADSGPADWYMSLLDPVLNDCVYFGNDEKFNQVNVLNSTQGVATSNPVWSPEYSKGSGTWGALTATDGIGPNFKFVTTVHAQATFTPPVDWVTDTVNGQTAYWVRWRCSTDGVYTTRPISTQAWVFPVIQGSNGWRQLFKYYAGTTPAPLTAVWKIANATEYDTTFFYVTAETANVELISMRDVQASVDSGVAALTVNVNSVNKTFIRTAGSWATDGFVAGMQISPSGNATAANNYTRQISSITTTTNPNDTIIVTDNTGMNTEGGSGDERIIAWPFNSNITGGGTGSGFSGYTNSNAALYRNALPQITTTKNDCLIIYACAPDTPSIPSIIEGPCQLIAGKDGAAHSDGMAWGYQKTAGGTSAAVYMTQMTAYVTEMAVVAVNPPHAAVTVRPAYCISDSSIYINPLSGPAFGSDSLTANTVTTPFTGTINGMPLVAGTYASLGDVGINSYHAMQQLTGVVTAGRWAGLRTTIAARANWANKNILFHIQPYLPVDIQTADSVSLSGAIGVAIGFASTAGNFKVWHVAGAGVYGDTQRHQPVVINTGAADGVIQSTGSFNPDSVTEIGFMVSGKVVAADWLLGSAWLLDTFVIVGGIAAEPILLSDIVKSYAISHERRSAIQQGSKQALFLGPVQIGDGTNFTYLNLDATAIEFPRQYNKALKEVYYNSINNVCGLKYYAAAGDTIIHKNSVISSASRYFWGLHSSFDTSVTPDFSGTSVIGAGTISLARAVIITQLTINDYVSIDATGLTLTYSIIKGVPAANDSIILTAVSNVDYCTINVSGVTSGNRWCSVVDPSIFSGCSFTGGGGHAIRITTPGTYELSGNTFTSFGADGTNGAAIFNDSSGLVTLNITNGGSTLTIKNGTSASTTINNNRTITLTGLQNPSEVRVFYAGTVNEVAGTGAENIITGTHAFSVTVSTSIDINILALGYQNLRMLSYTASADATLPISQVLDRQYNNP